MAEIEYRTLDLEVRRDRQSWESVLVPLGRQGWEVCGVVPLIDVNLGGLPLTKAARLVLMRRQPMVTPCQEAPGTVPRA